MIDDCHSTRNLPFRELQVGLLVRPCLPRCMSRSLTRESGSPTRDSGSPARDSGSPARESGNPAGMIGNSAGMIGSPACMIGSPTCMIGSPTCMIGSPTCMIGSPTCIFLVPMLRVGTDGGALCVPEMRNTGGTIPDWCYHCFYDEACNSTDC
jgi:hypothetical protein